VEVEQCGPKPKNNIEPDAIIATTTFTHQLILAIDKL
jgi:hypothetical protein